MSTIQDKLITLAIRLPLLLENLTRICKNWLDYAEVDLSEYELKQSLLGNKVDYIAVAGATYLAIKGEDKPDFLDMLQRFVASGGGDARDGRILNDVKKIREFFEGTEELAKSFLMTRTRNEE